MREIKITKEWLDKFKFEVKFPKYAGWIVPCDCGWPDCTGEKIFYNENL